MKRSPVSFRRWCAGLPRIEVLDRGRLAAICLAALVGALPSRVDAVGVRIPNQDPEAIGRGNAFVATANNPSAIYYNPAGITQLEGHNVQVGLLAYLGIYVEYESPGGQSFDSETEIFPIPQIYYTFTPETLPLSFGLGIYAPFGLGVEWPEDTGFRTRSIEAHLKYVTINPVIGWKPCAAFSIAAGPTLNYSEIELRNGFLSPVPSPNDEFKFDGDDWSAGFNVGILIQPHPKWSFGVNYRGAATTDYEGTTTIRSPVPAIPGGKAGTSLEIDFPQIVSFGVSYRPTPKWNLEVNVDYSDWDTLNTVSFKGTSSLLGNDATLPLNWHGSWFYEAGVSYYFENGYYVSAGYFFSSLTTGSTDFTPSVPDTELHIGSLGFGYKGQHWRWAVAAQIMAGPAREIDHASPNVVDGSYTLWTPTISASLGYHF